MAKFRKKPVVIEAVRYNGGDDKAGYYFAEMKPNWLAEAWSGDRPIVRRHHDGTLRIVTLEGEMTAQPGDWIIQGVNGEIYPCKPDIFSKTYEPADE